LLDLAHSQITLPAIIGKRHEWIFGEVTRWCDGLRRIGMNGRFDIGICSHFVKGLLMRRNLSVCGAILIAV
jgi:hypothetical protein